MSNNIPREIIANALYEKGFRLKHTYEVNDEIVDYWVDSNGKKFSVVVDEVTE